MSGNEYNTAGDTGSGGGGNQDGWLFLFPCSVHFFFPTFIENQNKNKKKSRVLRDEYFPSLLIEKKTKGLFCLLSEQKRKHVGSSERIFFFKVTRIYFFIENIRNMIKKRYPGVDKKLYIAALHIKKNVI